MTGVEGVGNGANGNAYGLSAVGIKEMPMTIDKVLVVGNVILYRTTATTDEGELTYLLQRAIIMSASEAPGN